jgi:tRNA(Arg) A34 adenosine deaminase TadA
MSTPPAPAAEPDPSVRWHAHLRRANAVAAAALAAGHHPFGALLVAPDGSTVLLEQGNAGPVDHAEAVLARRASVRHDPGVLWQCTLVTTVEPCAMCASTQCWAHIGRVVYGLSESALRTITGDHPENPTLDLPCREVFARGVKPVEVIGPVPALADEIAALHLAFWRRDRP